MSEKDRITETKVKHSGLFNFGEVYGFIYTLLTDLEYSVEEKVYSEKTKGDQKDIEVTWFARRNVSDYIRFIVKLDFKILRMSTVEVMKEGIKTSMNKGDFEVKVGGFLERDYENRWGSTAFLKFFRGIYDRYIIKSTREGYEEKIGGEVNDISNQTKAFLTLSVAK